MLAETFLDVRGSKLHARRGGSGQPLLFLHGTQGLAGREPALELLARQFDVIAPDHPGFGQSDNQELVEDVPDLAFFYLDLLASLNVTGVHVVGHSLGGWIAMEMAIRSTARLRSLTLAGSAGIRVKGVPRADMFIRSSEDLARLLFAGDGWSAWHDAWMSTDRVGIYERNIFAAAKMTWQPRLFNPKLAKWLHRIDIPTLILWGEDDRVVPPPYAEALKDLIPNSAVTSMPRCGHLSYVECPDLFAGHVARFAAETSS